MKQVRILSWNVNGIRSMLKKNFLAWLGETSPDILCLQETKAMPGQLPPELLHPQAFQVCWNPAQRLGYSGVCIFSKEKPLSIQRGFEVPRFDEEGRVLQAEFPEFTLFNIYFPNGKMNPERLQFKLDFYDHALDYFLKLKKEGKRLVIGGDYNTAHKAIDLKRPEENERVSGFLPEERAWMDKLVAHGFVDTFRVFNKEPDQYSWWDQRSGARERNVGWRIDYFFVSEDLVPHLDDAFIWPKVTGSDHCPVGMDLKF